MPKVRYERTGAAALLTIDRPERRNAVDAETAGLLLEGFRRFHAFDPFGNRLEFIEPEP